MVSMRLCRSALIAALLTGSALSSSSLAYAQELRVTRNLSASFNDSPYQQRREILRQHKRTKRNLAMHGKSEPPPLRGLQASRPSLKVQVPSMPVRHAVEVTRRDPGPLPVQLLEVQLASEPPASTERFVPPVTAQETRSETQAAVSSLPEPPPPAYTQTASLAGVEKEDLPAFMPSYPPEPVAKAPNAIATSTPASFFAWITAQLAAADHPIPETPTVKTAAYDPPAPIAEASPLPDPAPEEPAETVLAEAEAPPEAEKVLPWSTEPPVEEALAAHEETPLAQEQETAAEEPPAALAAPEEKPVELAQELPPSPIRQETLTEEMEVAQAAPVFTPQAHALAELAPASGPVASPAPVTPEPVTPEPTAAEIQPLEKTPPSAEPVPPSEPPPSLSPESKKILSRLPSNIGAPGPSEPGRIDIERARATEALFGEGEGEEKAEVKTHEAMGIKIDVKKPGLDINYELERAYNALVAGNSDAAIVLYQGVLSQAPDNTDAMFGLATAYHRSGQIEKARPLYGKILKIDPENTNALNNFLVLMADEAPDEALSQLKKLEVRNPEFSPIPAQMAVIYQKQGKTEEAVQAMLRAIALAPENLTYRFNLAVLSDKIGRHEEAAELYKQLLEAFQRGENIPNIRQIQERLTFLRSNNR